MTGLWRHPEFLKLWAGQTISVIGDQASILALPLTAVLLLSASPFEMGLLGVSQTLPWLLVSLLAGAWVDRLPRRPILIVADLGRAALLVAVPIGAAFGWLRIEHLYLVGFLTGVLNVFFGVAYQAFLPSLIQRRDLVEGNTKLELSSSLAQGGGPGLAGVLVQRFGAPMTLGLDAASFLVSALSVLLIKPPHAAPAPVGRRAIWLEISEGLRVLLRNPVLRAIVLNAATFNLAANMVSALYVLYASRELGLPPDVLGLVVAARGLGAIVGALTAGRVGQVFGTGPSLLLATTLSSVGLVVIPLAHGASAAAVLGLGQVLFGMGVPFFNVHQASLRQTMTPDHLQGRINASFRFLVRGPAPVGALLGGALGDTLGLLPAIVLGSACGVIAMCWLIASPVRRLASAADAPPL
jgi:MFS family permease